MMATYDFPNSLVGRAMQDAEQASKPNAFGDAAAAPQPGLARLGTQAGMQSSPAPSGSTGPLQRSVAGLAGVAAPAAGMAGGSLMARAFGTSGNTPSPATSMPGNPLVNRAFADAASSNAVKFDPATNTYSGGNVAGDISLNGAAPSSSGLMARAFGNPSPAAAPAPSAGQSLIDRAFTAQPGGQNLPQFSAPQVAHSGNDWEARNNLRNLEVSASSITNNGGRFDSRQGRANVGPSLAQAAYLEAQRADQAARGEQPRLDMATTQVNAGLQREGMEQAGNQQRSLVQAAMDQQRNQNDLTRTSMTEDGANQRSLISALGGIQEAQTRAAAGNAPSGYRFNANGGLEAIPGGPADKSQAPLNDVQSKALQFGSRMEESDRNLTKLAAQGINQPGLIKRAADAIGIGGAANWTQSPQQQQVEQSQRDFINAVLRRESGAAIADSEFDNARKQYFPQPGDAPDVIQQKMRNRAIATAGIKAEVPNAEDRIGQVLGVGRATNSAVGGLPPGMTKQIGTSGGKPVYEDAQGNRFMGG